MNTLLKTNRGFWKYFFLGIITLGIYPLYIIHAFAKETNIACEGDGEKTQGLLVYILLGIVTSGIYWIIWNFMIVERRNNFTVKNNIKSRLTEIFYLVSVFLGPFTLGILNIIFLVKFLHQQNDVNQIYNSKIAQVASKQ